jgi:phage shock protein C
MRGRKFELDRGNRKLFGVCGGISNLTGVDATFVRVGVVVLTLALPWMILIYGIAAWFARPKRNVGYDIKADIAMLRSGARDDYRSRMRDIDMRLAALDPEVAAPQSRRLSREIDELR